MTTLAVPILGVSQEKIHDLQKIFQHYEKKKQVLPTLNRLKEFFGGVNSSGFLASLFYLKHLMCNSAVKLYDHAVRAEELKCLGYLVHVIFQEFMGRANVTPVEEIHSECLHRVCDILLSECGCEECARVVKSLRTHHPLRRLPKLNTHAIHCPGHRLLTHLHNSCIISSVPHFSTHHISTLLFDPDDFFDFSSQGRRELAWLSSCIHLCFAYMLFKKCVLQEMEILESYIQEGLKNLNVDLSEQPSLNGLAALHARSKKQNHCPVFYVDVSSETFKDQSLKDLNTKLSDFLSVSPGQKQMLLTSLGPKSWLLPPHLRLMETNKMSLTSAQKAESSLIPALVAKLRLTEHPESTKENKQGQFEEVVSMPKDSPLFQHNKSPLSHSRFGKLESKNEVNTVNYSQDENYWEDDYVDELGLIDTSSPSFEQETYLTGTDSESSDNEEVSSLVEDTDDTFFTLEEFEELLAQNPPSSLKPPKLSDNQLDIYYREEV